MMVAFVQKLCLLAREISYQCMHVVQSKMDSPEKLAAYIYTRQRKTMQKHYTMCVGHHYMQANTNNVNKTRSLLYL